MSQDKKEEYTAETLEYNEDGELYIKKGFFSNLEDAIIWAYEQANAILVKIFNAARELLYCLFGSDEETYA